MKICSVCHKEKSKTQFYKKRNGLTNRCSDCERIYQEQYYIKNREKRIVVAKKHSIEQSKRNKQYVIEYLTEHPCIDCGESDVIVLQFDHLRDKRYNLSEKISSGRPVSLKKLQDEINKCDVRCANCHLRKTSVDYNFWKVGYVLPARMPSV